MVGERCIRPCSALGSESSLRSSAKRLATSTGTIFFVFVAMVSIATVLAWDRPAGRAIGLTVLGLILLFNIALLVAAASRSIGQHAAFVVDESHSASGLFGAMIGGRLQCRAGGRGGTNSSMASSVMQLKTKTVDGGDTRKSAHLDSFFLFLLQIFHYTNIFNLNKKK